MPLRKDQDIAELLGRTRTIALVGASEKPERPSHDVMRFLLDEGYDVYPVNPGLVGQTLHGREVYAHLADIPVDIDMIDVFRQPRFLRGIVEAAVDVGAGAIWTQLGVIDERAATDAERAGIDVVMDRCPKIEIPRLRAAGLFGPRS